MASVPSSASNWASVFRIIKWTMDVAKLLPDDLEDSKTDEAKKELKINDFVEYYATHVRGLAKLSSPHAPRGCRWTPMSDQSPLSTTIDEVFMKWNKDNHAQMTREDTDSFGEARYLHERFPLLSSSDKIYNDQQLLHPNIAGLIGWMEGRFISPTNPQLIVSADLQLSALENEYKRWGKRWVAAFTVGLRIHHALVSHPSDHTDIHSCFLQLGTVACQSPVILEQLCKIAHISHEQPDIIASWLTGPMNRVPFPSSVELQDTGVYKDYLILLKHAQDLQFYNQYTPDSKVNREEMNREDSKVKDSESKVNRETVVKKEEERFGFGSTFRGIPNKKNPESDLSKKHVFQWNG